MDSQKLKKLIIAGATIQGNTVLYIKGLFIMAYICWEEFCNCKMT